MTAILQVTVTVEYTNLEWEIDAIKIALQGFQNVTEVQVEILDD